MSLGQQTRRDRQLAAQARAENALRTVLAKEAGTWRTVTELLVLLRA